MDAVGPHPTIPLGPGSPLPAGGVWPPDGSQLFSSPALPSVGGSRLCPSLRAACTQCLVPGGCPAPSLFQDIPASEHPSGDQLSYLFAKHQFRLCLNPVGVQNRFPPNVPLWHIHYVELKAIKTLQTHKKYVPFP